MSEMTMPNMKPMHYEEQNPIDEPTVLPASVIVVDFESTSLGPNAALLSVGMIAGFLNTDITTIDTLPTYKSNIDLNEQYLMGRDFAKDTQEWWQKELKKHPELISVLDDLKPVREVIEGITAFIKEYHDKDKGLIFCRHTHGDWVWLNGVCQSLGVKNPVRYDRILDVTTWLSSKNNGYLNYIEEGHPREYLVHDALEDVKRDFCHIILSQAL